MSTKNLKYFEKTALQLQRINDNDLAWEVIWEELKYVLREEIAPTFWSHFKCGCHSSLVPSVYKNRYQQFEMFATAVKYLDKTYKDILELLNSLDLIASDETTPEMKIEEMLRNALLAQLPAHFSDVVGSFYFVSLSVFDKVYPEDGTESFVGHGSNSGSCNGCSLDIKKCRCNTLNENIKEVNHILISLGLLDKIAGQTITVLIQTRIETHINTTCQGVLDRSQLRELEIWLENRIINWLIWVFNNGNLVIAESDIHTKKVIEGFSVKLTYFLFEHFAQVIIDQFFNIIIDFPESTPAIDDLKICMEKIDLRKQLMKNLKSSLESRILHPGVNTTDILTGYVAAIKAIRHLDPSGVILENVTEPIKDYLRRRTDTVRRVVTSLTDEGPTDLSEELAKGETIKDKLNSIKNEIDDWETWMPDPFCVESKNPKPSCVANRTADIISMIVDIYGSKELFMNEYRNLMAERMLTNLDLSPEKEIRNLELLKLRFGENLLHNCEVMIKDISDSKRINAHIRTDPNYLQDKEFDISLLIISAQFWPVFNKESLELPAEIQEEFKKYTKSYEAYKGNRTLNLRTVTGKVCIEVELKNKTFELTVSPTQAIILYHFQRQDEWTLDELSNIMKVPQSTLRRRIAFWVNYGILIEKRVDEFKLVEDSDVQQGSHIDVQNSNVEPEEEIESAMASANDQREEELQVFWSYIVGMLTNLDSLPLERIHQMLKLFASNGVGKEFSQEELKDFLQRKVREHKLIYSGGVYQLAK